MSVSLASVNMVTHGFPLFATSWGFVRMVVGSITFQVKTVYI